MKNYVVNPVGLVNNSRVYNEKNSYFGDSGDSYNKINYNYSYNYNLNYNNNLANVCYINSSIQCLFHLKKFVNFIAGSSGNPGSSLFIATRNLLVDMINAKNLQNKNLSIEKIKEAMSKIDKRYKNNNQEDANEFISNFLNALLDETSDKSKFMEIKTINIKDSIVREAYIKFYNKFYKRKGKSPLLDIFYGNFITEKYCKKCKSILSIKFNAFNMLELPIYKLSISKKYYNSLTLDEILNSFFAESKIDDDFCPLCNQEIYCRSWIYKLPETLIIYFGRTVNEEFINNKIDYNKQINLSKYLFNKNYSNDNQYKLCCIIYYMSFEKKSGHYTASCICNDGEWYHFDDQIISKGQQFNSNEIILFYDKYN